jgi:hypothetical protein
MAPLNSDFTVFYCIVFDCLALIGGQRDGLGKMAKSDREHLLVASSIGTWICTHIHMNTHIYLKREKKVDNGNQSKETFYICSKQLHGYHNTHPKFPSNPFSLPAPSEVYRSPCQSAIAVAFHPSLQRYFIINPNPLSIQANSSPVITPILITQETKVSREK